MELYDALDQCQSHPRPFAACIELVEESKNIIQKLRRNTHAIIPDIKDVHAIAHILLPDLDARGRLVVHKFGSVIDQVLQYLQQALIIPKYKWKVFGDTDCNISLGNSAM